MILSIITRLFTRRNAPLIVAFSFTFCLLMLSALLGKLPRSSGKVELLFPASSEALSWLEIEREVFESSYIDTITLSKSSGAFDSEDYFLLEEFESELLALDGVISLTLPRGENSHDIFGLLSKDREHLRAILKINSSLTEAERSFLNNEIWKVLEKFSMFQPNRAGSFVTTQEVALAVQEETNAIVPWILGALLLALLTLTRSIKVSLLVLVSTGLSLVMSVLIYALCGYEMGPVSQLAPPFLLAVGTSFHLHFVSRFLSTPPEDRSAVVVELRRGIALAATTTALSLLSLILLNVADVTRFAVLSSLGITLAALFSCYVQLPTLKLLASRGIHFRPFSTQYLVACIRKRAVLFALLSSALLAFGVVRLEIHTDPLRFLPENSRALRSIENVNSLFPGNHYLSLLLLPSVDRTVPLKIDLLERIEEKIESLNHVEHVISPVDFEKLLSLKYLADFVSDFSLRESNIPADFFSAEDGALRLLIETQVEGKDLIQLSQQIEHLLGQFAELRDYSIGITSIELIMAQQTTNIVEGLIESLCLTLGTVFLLLLLIFRSLRVATIGLVPNIIPLLSVFGVLGFTLQDLDFGSCLVAASALGIAVDNTFHFLLCWKKQGEKFSDLARATGESVSLTAYPFSITSISLIAGFSMMFFARSLPVAHFGILLSITLLVGLFADLVVLPFLLGRGQVKFS